MPPSEYVEIWNNINIISIWMKQYFLCTSLAVNKDILGCYWRSTVNIMTNTPLCLNNTLWQPSCAPSTVIWSWHWFVLEFNLDIEYLSSPAFSFGLLSFCRHNVGEEHFPESVSSNSKWAKRSWLIVVDWLKATWPILSLETSLI